MKRKALGEDSEALMRGTAAQAVGVATGRKRPELVAVSEEPKPKYVSMNIRVPQGVVFAIQDEALRRFKERNGGGKPDQSEVVRDLLLEWMARRGLPA